MSSLNYDVNDEPISGYRIVEFLGEGNFGTVWKAIETESEIYVALKVIDLSRSPSALKELKGLNLVRNLRHPNLIPIYTARIKDRDGRELPIGKAEEVRAKDQLSELVIAMGLGDRSLSARLKQSHPPGASPADYRGLPLEEVLGYMYGAAKGIDYLNRADHNLGPGVGDGPIIHCDIKPDNLMIVAGEIQIADCGVAVLVTPDARQTRASCSLAYSPPELPANKPSPGTDQYSLAITYSELRTGQLPIPRNLSQLEVMLAHAEGKLDFSHRTLTKGESLVLKWATAVQPKTRYSSCWEMVKQLEQAARGQPPVHPADVGKVPPDVITPRADRITTPAPAAEPPADNGGLTGTTDAFPLENAGEYNGNFGTLTPAQIDLVGLAHTQLPKETRPTELAPGGADALNANSTTHPDAPKGSTSLLDSALFRPTLTAPDVVAPAATRTGNGTPPAKPTPPPRPKMSVDPADPMGAHYGTVSLVPELQAIIRPSALTPPVVTPAVAPLLPAPWADTPGLEGTQFLQNPAAEDPAEEPTKPSPARLPVAADDAESWDPPQSFVKLTPFPELRKGRSKWPTRLVTGGLILGTLAAGGIYIPPLFTDPPSPIVDPPLPVVDRFAADMAELTTIPADRLQDAATAVLTKYPAADQQKSLLQTLIEIGQQQPDRRTAITNALGEGSQFASRVPDTADRAEVARWHVPHLESVEYADALKAVQKLYAQPVPAEDIAAAQEAVSKLQAAIDTFDGRFASAESVPAAVRDFLTTASAWSAARSNPSALKPFAERLATESAERPFPVAFTVELIRISARESTPIDAIRAIRDRVSRGSVRAADEKARVQEVYQEILAAHVRDALSRPDPNWELILKACGSDDAHGWAKLVAAEPLLASRQKNAAAITALLDEAEKTPATAATGADKKEFATYIRAVAKKDEAAADQLEQLYRKPSPLLKVASRQKRAAAVLGTNGMAAPTQNKTTAELLSDKANPFSKNVRALGWLRRADELDGKAHPGWAIPLALLADAGGDRKTVEAVTARVTVDDTKVADEDLPLAVAYLQLQVRAADEPAVRAAAGASYARAAYRILEYAFGSCPTQKDGQALEAKLIPKIEAVVDESLGKAEVNGPDQLALRLAKVRARVLIDPLIANDPANLGRELDDLVKRMDDTHPDKADAYGYRAYVTFMGFSGADPARPPAASPRDASEAVRVKAWQSIAQDAASGLRLDATNRTCNTVTAYQIATEFDAFPPYAAPRAERKVDAAAAEAKVFKAVKAFEAAAAKMPTRKLSTFWAARGSFLLDAATDFAKAGKMANVKPYLDAAETALKKANDQRADADANMSKSDKQLLAKRYDERRLLGCVFEAKAWLVREDPATNYQRALEYLKIDHPPESDQEFQGGVDFARCLIHGVRSGVLPASRSGEADAILDQHHRAADAILQNPSKSREVKAAVDRHVLRGEYWQLVLFLHRLEASLDGGSQNAKLRTELLSQADAKAEKWEALLKKDPTIKATAFVPEYLRGRIAVKNNKTGMAAEHFKKAFDLLDAASTEGRLRVDDSFAMKSLVNEMTYCYTFLSPANRQKRIALLVSLEQRYGWALTDKDRESIKTIKKLK
ncbi:protein kinase domain-containing protein [Limnoglobus roseus]|uniref:Serine/threonine protein kinase n=1 Tax=Limnoglobus roseus TaxID=2598579 RepID=A0A5C1AQP8_9BACT|nr:protein kinase [Limnoglobus roseus]QEL20945.1 serine/threonine protein kinase [Limnoglobus roseus]